MTYTIPGAVTNLSTVVTALSELATAIDTFGGNLRNAMQSGPGAQAAANVVLALGTAQAYLKGSGTLNQLAWKLSTDTTFRTDWTALVDGAATMHAGWKRTHISRNVPCRWRDP